MPLLPTDPKDRRYMTLGLKIAADFGAGIAAPVVIFVLIGQYIEKKYGGAPFVTMGAFVLAAVISGIYIYKKAKQYGKEFADIDPPKQDKQG